MFRSLKSHNTTKKKIHTYIHTQNKLRKEKPNMEVIFFLNREKYYLIKKKKKLDITI
jgi:hypothetical protein